MTEHTRGQASDPDTYDARADGGISNTWAHSASSRITVEVSPPSNRSPLARPLHPVPECRSRHEGTLGDSQDNHASDHEPSDEGPDEDRRSARADRIGKSTSVPRPEHVGPGSVRFFAAQRATNGSATTTIDLAAGLRASATLRCALRRNGQGDNCHA